MSQFEAGTRPWIRVGAAAMAIGVGALVASAVNARGPSPAPVVGLGVAPDEAPTPDESRRMDPAGSWDLDGDGRTSDPEMLAVFGERMGVLVDGGEVAYVDTAAVLAHGNGEPDADGVYRAIVPLYDGGGNVIGTYRLGSDGGVENVQTGPVHEATPGD